MRIAVVGAGRVGLEAARLLGEDPRHVTTVFETRARVDVHRLADALVYLDRLGVTLRRSAQVERLGVDDTGADLWVNGLPERFDLALVTTSAAQRQALLTRSGFGRCGRTVALRERVYFSEPGSADPVSTARSLLARFAAAHPGVAPPRPLHPDESPAHERVAHVLRALSRHARRDKYVDLSGETWPLTRPAVYIANRRWVLDSAVTGQLLVRSLQVATPGDVRAATQALEAGTSLASVVAPAHGPASRAAAMAALALNAPIVPLAAHDPPGRASPCVVIGEPFYAQTSWIEELTDDMGTIVRHLERLAVEHSRGAVPAPTGRSSRTA